VNLILTLILWTFMGCPDAEEERRKVERAPVAQMDIGEIVVIRRQP
jgi:hypothetical protein